MARLIAVLLASGLALLLAAIVLSAFPANATERSRTLGDAHAPQFVYTDHPSRASTGRMVGLYVDREFDDYERQRIVAAMRQWNYVLNGFVRFTARLLPDDPSPGEIAQIRRSGGWIVAKVDSSHPVTGQAEGRNALAVTVSGSRGFIGGGFGGGGGFVYVIGDRIGRRDLTGVVMHEFGHVLGAGHDGYGLMAPVYNANSALCIDRDAASLVAKAQRLPLAQMNWCEPAGGYAPPMASRR